jgi:hypothetical protein
MEARRGKTRAARLDAQHDSATGRVALAGDALTSMPDEQHAQDGPHTQSIEELPLLLAMGFWPIRRSRFGGLRGAPSCARRG